MIIFLKKLVQINYKLCIISSIDFYIYEKNSENGGGLQTMKLSKFSFLLALGFLLSVFMVACSGEESSGSNSPESSDNNGEAAEEEEVEQVFHLLNGDTIPTMDSSLATD